MVDFPGPRATTDYLRQFGSGRADEPVRYALVTPDGEITFGDAPLRDIPAAFEGGGDGETGTEYLSLYPVAFVDRHNRGLSAEQESVITGAHRTAVARLRARGWL
ncbi:hypothetical protein [Streptomyces virginiae]|uniref:hypothetical protein n=1 Tax=Streptomyces virginiae TaxID=1961 RepID=UPI0036A6F26C